MRIQEYMIEVTRNAAEEAFRYAKAVPEDKLEWSPLESGRSVIDLCRELAVCPTWAKDTIDSDGTPEWNEEQMLAAENEQKHLKTVDECHAECKRRLEELFELYRNLPDERLTEAKWLPYEGGRNFTMPEMMDYPRWNFNYHTGQIAFIQTLYGDKEMY